MSRRTLGEATSSEEKKAGLLGTPWPYVVAGAMVLAIGLWLMIGGRAESARTGDTVKQVRAMVSQLESATDDFRAVLRSDSVQAEAARVLAGDADPADLVEALQSQDSAVVRVDVFGPDVFMRALEDLGDNGFVKLDMLAAANADELSPVQLVDELGERYIVAASTVGRAVQQNGFLLAYAEPDGFLATLAVAEPAAGYLSVELKAGANAPVKLREFGSSMPSGHMPQRVPVAGSLLQVTYPRPQGGAVGSSQQWALIVIGLGLLALGVVRLRQAKPEVEEVEPVPDHFVTMTDTALRQRNLPPTLKDARANTRSLPEAKTQPSEAAASIADSTEAGSPKPTAPEWDAPPSESLEPESPESAAPEREETEVFASNTAAPKTPSSPFTDDSPLVGRISDPAPAIGDAESTRDDSAAAPGTDRPAVPSSSLTGMPSADDEEVPPSLRPTPMTEELGPEPSVDVSAAPAAAPESGTAPVPEVEIPSSAPAQDAPEPAASAPEAIEPAPAPAVPPTPGVRLKSHIFRAYDIRGIVGETLDRGIAYQIGQAVGSFAQDSLATPVVVGRDGRHSGPELAEGLRDGLRASGCDVIDIGAVPTGVLYFAAHEFGNGSGVMVTGSHNPPDYNGFKIMIGGRTLAGEDIFGLFERIRTDSLLHGEGQLTEQDAIEAYRERIAGDIQLKRPLKVVADCGNGIGGVCATDVLQAIGAEVIPLFEEVDGDFPNHHPDPSEPENLEDLIEQLRLTQADLGLAFDGDADRLGVVTPDGEIVFSDRVMMLYAREVLGRNPGAKIIYDVKCTGHLDTVIREAGGEPEMYKTGHSLMKNRMRDVGSPLAGEMSGHFFFKDRWYGFDCGIYSACRLLEILAMEEGTPQEVLGALPDSVSTPELKVHLEEGENHAFIEAFRQQANFPGARITNIDGVRADFADGWGLVRASNTTPILVLRFDADSERSLHNVKEAFRAQLLAVRSDLDLPF